MSQTEQRDYRDTLNLPSTAFPMKADLPKREPARIEWWREHRTFERRLEHNRAAGPFILHDGPPYANGNLHMGHFLSMVLKDMLNKIALMDGKWANFVPGWDMHGLPIELDTLKHLKIKDFHAIDPLELREQCRQRALHWLDRQRHSRMRMGNFGDWEHPYRTIDPSFEAAIVETLAELVKNGQIYRGLRSTLWCIHDETALAEAEIEYKDKVSPSIYVRFAANEAQRAELLSRFAACHPEQGNARSEFPVVEGQPSQSRLAIVIWTTTPWTLPANVAIALKSDAQYGLYKHGDELLIVAAERAPHVLGEHFGSMDLLGTVTGDSLSGLAVRHPFLDRDSAIVTADYVDLETGTGAVHTAPGHGADDFDTGVKFGLPVINPVDARGVFTAEAGPYAGMHIWKANPKIVEDLRESGALWDAFEFTHSYPHCWRCHNPVIFRATAQWFISMDHNDLRARTIKNIHTVKWTPEWGEQRIAQMLENHPEWCISRQRTWGTPIPSVRCTQCNESILDERVARIAAGRFREESANTWWSAPVNEFLPDDLRCPKCSGSSFEKEFNIVDIWFESGVTNLAVLGGENLPWPSDLVVEGADQYRGWFRSSIVLATAVRGAAPYRHVVKQGWVNDEQGRAMSKSLGTGIEVDEAMNKWGADVLRLWVASTEFVDDVRFGPNVIDQVSRVYRNIRNRLRFMLSNIEDLPADAVTPREKMSWYDALACDVADGWAARMRDLLVEYRLHDAYLEALRFESDDLSSFYLDALKDRLYSNAADSPARRSAQSALLHILKRFTTALAIVLSFTTEEAWQHVPAALRGDAESVFDLELYHGKGNEKSEKAWSILRDLRARVAASEGKRDYELQGVLYVSNEWFDTFTRERDSVREALVLSALTVREDQALKGNDMRLDLLPAEGGKCVRCWKTLPLGSDPAHPELCAPCARIIATA